MLDVTILQVIPRGLSADEELIVQQAFAGLCWSKQFYRFDGSSLYSTDGGMSAVFQRQVTSSIVDHLPPNPTHWKCHTT